VSLEPMMGLASSKQERFRTRAAAGSHVMEFEIIVSSMGITPPDSNIALFLIFQKHKYQKRENKREYASWTHDRQEKYTHGNNITGPVFKSKCCQL